MTSHSPLASLSLMALDCIRVFIDGTPFHKSPLVKAVNDEMMRRIKKLNDEWTKWNAENASSEAALQSQPPPPPPPAE